MPLKRHLITLGICILPIRQSGDHATVGANHPGGAILRCHLNDRISNFHQFLGGILFEPRRTHLVVQLTKVRKNLPRDGCRLTRWLQTRHEAAIAWLSLGILFLLKPSDRCKDKQ